MHTLKVNGIELQALLDALSKAASRHESYAKFYPHQKTVGKHTQMAKTMRALQQKLEIEAR